MTTADRCIDGPGTKIIDGREVTRDCWSYERTLTCTGAAPLDSYAPLVAWKVYTPGASTCTDSPGDWRVRGPAEQLQLPVSSPDRHDRLELPQQRVLPGRELLQHQLPNDADFARSMSMLEAIPDRRVPRHQPDAGLPGARPAAAATSC